MDVFNSSPIVRTEPRGAQIVWYMLGLVEVALAFRFVLRFLDSPNAGFTHFIYTSTQVFVAPFLNMFHITYVEGSVFDWTTVVAMAVYWIVATGITRLFTMEKTISTPHGVMRWNNRDRVNYH